MFISAGRGLGTKYPSSQDWQHEDIHFWCCFLPLQLRNEFHFCDIDRSMNAMVLVQSKCRPKGVTLTLHWTYCVHTSMHVTKMKFITYVFTLFVYRFCLIFMKFWYKSCTCKKVINDVFDRRLLDMMSIERYVDQSTISVIHDVAYVQRHMNDCLSSVYEHVDPK